MSDRGGPTFRSLAAALGAGALTLSAAGLALCLVVPDAPLDHQPLIEARFPGVAWVSTASLAAELERARPILLDVRTHEEFAVSHIPGALRVEPGRDASTFELPRGGPVVVYCSVGYRSADFARGLRARGVGVRNLAGGVFQWANERRPLVQDGRPTDLVHPYDAVWGRLLHTDARAPLD